MEGSHGQLGARFADGLGSHDADGFPDIYRSAMGQIPAITFGTNSVPGLAGEHRTDPEFFQPCFLNILGRIFVDFLIGIYNNFISVRVDNIFQGGTPQNTFSDPLNDLATFYQGGHIDTINSAAIQFGDDTVLSYVYQPSGKITGVSGFQGSVGQSFAGAVSGNKIL